MKAQFLILKLLLILSISVNGQNQKFKKRFKDKQQTISTQINIVSTPNPNLFPLLYVMAEHPELNIKLIPVGKSSELTEQLNKQADAMVSMTYVAAKQVTTNKVPDLQLLSVVYWSGFYEVTEKNIKNFEDLKGKKIIVSGPVGTGKNGGPDVIFKAALKKSGFNIDNDFQVEYLPVNEGMEKVKNGEASAILLAEPAGTGFKMMMSMKSGTSVEKTVNLQSILSESSAWDKNVLPLGGFSAKQSSLNDPKKGKIIHKINQLYQEAANEMMESNIMKLSKISKLFKEYYKDIIGNGVPPMVLKKAINQKTLVYNGNFKINKNVDELNKFFELLLEEKLPKSFFSK